MLGMWTLFGRRTSSLEKLIDVDERAAVEAPEIGFLADVDRVALVAMAAEEAAQEGHHGTRRSCARICAAFAAGARAEQGLTGPQADCSTTYLVDFLRPCA